jgi:hypothetical protein
MICNIVIIRHISKSGSSVRDVRYVNKHGFP